MIIMEEEEHEIMNRTLRRKKSSVVGNIACCFNGTASTHAHHRRRASLDGNVPLASHHRKTATTTSTSTWFKSKTNDLPEIKGRCRSFISRMGRHRRHASADFSYDPLSYSLNFDHVDEPSSSHYPVMDFNARLPLTPPRRPFQENHHPLPRSSPEGNEDLRRGFEALSVSLKGSPVRSGQRRNNNSSNTDQEEVNPTMTTPPLSSSSNHGVLVQLC